MTLCGNPGKQFTAAIVSLFGLKANLYGRSVELRVQHLRVRHLRPVRRVLRPLLVLVLTLRLLTRRFRGQRDPGARR